MPFNFLTRAGAYVAARVRTAALQKQIARKLGMRVQAGPFAGMALPQKASWGGGNLAPKIFGCYEAELHPALEKAIARTPDVVANVGCAEGYFAVGLARRLPQAKVHAFDISTKAQSVCTASAAENGVGDRLQAHGRCDGAQLAALGASARRMLVVMDCEGAELALLDAPTVKALRNADFIIECHDFFDRRITPTLTALLKAEHDVELIREGPRDPAAYPVLERYSSLDRALAVCEFRKEVTNWLVAWSR